MISQAIVNGRTHRLMQQNSHDSVHSGSPQPGHAFGLVLDGCGSKYPDGTPSHNEVGAKLLGQFAAAWLKQQLADAAQRASMGENELGQMLAALHQDCIAFLQTINAAMPWQSSTDTAKFVSTHLLATMVGFIVTPETAVFFWQGDGYLAHNGHVTTLDSNNRPDYLAYHVLRQEAEREKRKERSEERSADQSVFASAPHTFQTHYLDRAALQWLAVATDGWQAAQLTQLGEPRSSLQLQRWLNMQTRTVGSFEDDGAVAIWWHEA